MNPILSTLIGPVVGAIFFYLVAVRPANKKADEIVKRIIERGEIN